MSLFIQHTENTAPDESSEVLKKVKDRYGFIPNLAAYLAESPLVLETVMSLSTAFERSGFSKQEQQFILLTVSTLNNCDYCQVAHTALANSVALDTNIINAVLVDSVIPNQRLQALYDLIKALVIENGKVPESIVKQFLDNDYTQAQVFEIVMGVALKTLTNYSNHLANATPNEQFLKMANSKQN